MQQLLRLATYQFGKLDYSMVNDQLFFESDVGIFLTLCIETLNIARDAFRHIRFGRVL